MLMAWVPRRFVLFVGLLVVVGLGAPVGAFGMGDANQAACPNEAMEGFREYLPDCRGYEMVSPPFKSGQQAEVTAVSGDGSRVLGFSASFGGAAGNEVFGSSYEFVRSGSGWAASALDPSASLFSAPARRGVSDDFDRTLWTMRGLSQSVYTEDVYVREADGSFVMVGPLTPPSVAAGPPGGSYPAPVEDSDRIVGMSSDLSRVLVSIRSPETPDIHWPGDTTRIGGGDTYSLYEFVSTGNSRPVLVGVSDGSTIVNGVTLPAGRLISDCGTLLGSIDSQDSYNAVSASGETVFFTAEKATAGCRAEGGEGPPVNELYARLGGVETVAVSEPAPGQCEACSTTVRAGAEFQGASEDGSKAFFLTEQELLPGAKGMNLYEYDFDNPPGRKIVRVSIDPSEPGVEAGVVGVARVSDDGSHVYFVAKGVLTGANAEGAAPVAGEDNLYVFERDTAFPAGRLAFIGTLAEVDEWDWSTGDERPVQATPDGRFVVFDSVADLTPGDTSSQSQVFEYDAQAERLVRVSVGATGYPAGMVSADANGSSIASQSYVEGIGKRPAVTPGLAVSADGSVVIFSSVGALTPGSEVAAPAEADSVYEYRSVGSIADGGVYLLSNDHDTVSGEPPSLDASGDDVFFTTFAPLLAEDVDTQADVYDARVDGGFPPPVVPRVCEGEACQGSLPPSPSFVGPGSVSGVGGGNLTASPLGSAVSRPKVKPLTWAQKLAGALRVCRRERRRRERMVCEVGAHRRFGGRSDTGKGGR
jgi:hypothetical protein